MRLREGCLGTEQLGCRHWNFGVREEGQASPLAGENSGCVGRRRPYPSRNKGAWVVRTAEGTVTCRKARIPPRVGGYGAYIEGQSPVVREIGSTARK